MRITCKIEPNKCGKWICTKHRQSLFYIYNGVPICADEEEKLITEYGGIDNFNQKVKSPSTLPKVNELNSSFIQDCQNNCCAAYDNFKCKASKEIYDKCELKGQS